LSSRTPITCISLDFPSTGKDQQLRHIHFSSDRQSLSNIWPALTQNPLLSSALYELAEMEITDKIIIPPVTSISWDRISLQKRLGPRGVKWLDKLLRGIKFRGFIARLKEKGYTKDEIVRVVPEYIYDEDYHLPDGTYYRLNKSTADLDTGIGTSAGYSAWEWCGEI
jgi:hypothetical protein